MLLSVTECYECLLSAAKCFLNASERLLIAIECL